MINTKKYIKKIPKELFIEGDISCDLRKHNKKYYPIMKENEQIGEFSFFNFKIGSHEPLTVLFNDKITQKDFINSYQIFSNIFNKLAINSDEHIFFDYYTTNKEITKNLTRKSQKGRSAIYNIGISLNSRKDAILHKNNNDYSEYFFRKNTIGNFYMIERDNMYFIINKKQKENIVNNNIIFNAVPCEKIPYQIDKLDNKIINAKLFNPHTNSNMFFSLEKTSKDKILSYKTDDSFNGIYFINDNKYQAPKINLKEHRKLRNIYYYFMNNDFSRIPPNNNMLKGILESKKDIPNVEIVEEIPLNINYMREISEKIKRKNEEKPSDTINRDMRNELYQTDITHDYDEYFYY